MSELKRIFVGTAGWAVSGSPEAFPAEGSALERYSAVFDGLEINSSFHRRHRPATWQRWAASTPARFRFSVKVPKTITHQAKLVEVEKLLDQFAEDVVGLGPKLRVVLVQLPPSFAFDASLFEQFIRSLSARIEVPIACEPRHTSWFEPGADKVLDRLGVARVAADPALSETAAKPGSAKSLAYWRLHGSPQMYRSTYGEARIADYAARIAGSGARECWCMFDNTASSAAIGDALLMKEQLGAGHGG
ncbi:MAG: DUF72 domain-containing protein [Sphingomicrobium sp.]